MSTSSLESKLLLAQLHRFISGEELEPEVLQRLESELKTNPELREAATKFREELLGKSKPGKGSKLNLKALLEKIRAGTLPFKGKPVYYTIGLAVLLVAMTAFLRDPTAIFGPKASSSIDTSAEVQLSPSEEALSAAQETLEEPPDIVEDELNFELAAGNASLEALDGIKSPDSESGPPQNTQTTPGQTDGDPVKDTVFIAESGQPVQKTTAPRPRRAPASKAAAPKKSGITVYDENGKKISP